MWLLTNINTNDVLILINEKTKYTIGRVGADLIITGDTSVSRTHAFLHIAIDSNDPSGEKEILQLEDAGSKFGTFHNDNIQANKSLTKNVHLLLHDGDRIRFGLLHNIWKVSRCSLVSAISTLPDDQAQQIAQHLKVLGGKIQPTWDSSCTHLTMSQVSLTLKVLFALLDQKPIVTCNYWRDLLQAARRGRKKLPQVEAYLPTCSEDVTQNQQLDLGCRSERKSVFTGLTFVFLSALHLKTYAPIVEKAGGKSKHLNVGLQRSYLVRNDVVVIQYIPSTESQSSQAINSIEDYLKGHSRRIVPEYEIGLAIIHCSTEKYCNPNYVILADLMPKSMTTNISTDDSLVLATETRPNTATTTDVEQTEEFIPETDQKSVASTNISQKSTNPSTSSISEHINLCDDEFDADSSLPPISAEARCKEANTRKRTRASRAVKNVVYESDSDEELFNFSKKANIENSSSSPPTTKRVTRQQQNFVENTSTSITPKRITRQQQNVLENTSHMPSSESSLDEPSTSKKSKHTPKSSANPLPNVTIGRHQKGVVKVTGFLEKSQTTATDENTHSITTNCDNAIAKATGKRPRCAVLDNSDDDDLFCFGDEGPSGKTYDTKKSRIEDVSFNDNSDEELFAFDKAGDPHGVDQCDKATEPFVLNARSKKQLPIMPKPKLLPPKLNITSWLTFPNDKMNIKLEQMKDEVKAEQHMVQNKNNENLSDTDTSDVLIGGALVITLSKISLLHQENENNSKSSPAKNATRTTPTNMLKSSGKRFIKKFNPGQRKILRTVPVTVSGF